MLKISVTTHALARQRADALVFFLAKDTPPSGDLQTIIDAVFTNAPVLMKHKKFTGALGSSCIISAPHNEGATYLMLIGIGAEQGGVIPVEQYRRAVGSTVRLLHSHNAETAVIHVPAAELFGITDELLVHETALTAHMADYHFTPFITDNSRKDGDLTLELAVSPARHKAAEAGLKQGEIIATAVNQARYWVDLPALYATPEYLAAEAVAIGKKQGLKVTVFSEEEVIAKGMGGLAAVSAGSERDCKFVIMEYKTAVPGAPTIAIVGKGITFDSGGLSIKPAASMEDMKYDMSGAAAVLATMQVIGQLKPAVNVVGLTPICENLPSGSATKPGDVVTFYNGKTAEIKNTDAEGRLILADALSYAVKHYTPDAMIDLATLTGACHAALGPIYTGLMSKHPDLAEKVKKAGQISGDLVWELPLDNDYKPAIKSHVADLSNMGNNTYRGGAMTAALFLHEFVGATPWVHLDIAGTASDVPDRSYLRPGATGVGVRLLTHLLMNWQS